MVEWRKKSKRKPSGGINNSVNAKTKMLSAKGGLFSKTSISADDKRYKVRTKGGNSKVKISHAKSVLISDAGKVVKGKLLDVVENSANKQFVRQKIITKGSVVKADVNGKETLVKITSRPGQSGQVSGVVYRK